MVIALWLSYFCVLVFIKTTVQKWNCILIVHFCLLVNMKTTVWHLCSYKKIVLYSDWPTFVLLYLLKQRNKKCDSILIVRFLCLGKQKDNRITMSEQCWVNEKNLLFTSWQSQDNKKWHYNMIVQVLCLGK